MRVLVLVLAVMLLSLPAYALLDDNSTNQAQGQQQGQVGINDQEQGQLQGQGQAQGQGQGQGQLQGQTALGGTSLQAQGQASLQGNKQQADMNVEGDENTTYANAWPSLSGGEGVSQANAYSVFGGLGLSNTEQYKALITQIQAIEASRTLDEVTKEELVKELIEKMVDSNKKKRFLGLFWETSGRNLMNLFGVLSWDSFWKDGQHPFTK